MAGMTTQKRTGWTLSIMGMMALCGAAMGGATIVRLETLGGTSSQGFGINDNGVVVGQAATSGDAALHAVMWINGVVTDLDPAGTDSAAYAVNNSDQIVGKGDRLGGGSDAMLWDGGTATNLGIDMSRRGQFGGVGHQRQRSGCRARVSRAGLREGVCVERPRCRHRCRFDPRVHGRGELRREQRWHGGRLVVLLW